MPHKQILARSNEVAGSIGAAISGATASWTWIATANDVLQLVATGVAIVAGIYAIVWHRVRINQARRDNEQSK